MNIVNFAELKKKGVLVYDNGMQISFEENTIEIWHNFETVCTVNLDSVTVQLAIDILASNGVKLVMEDEDEL